VECESLPFDITVDMDEVWQDIFGAFSISLLLFLPLSFMLARHSLQPVRRSIEMMDLFINGIVHDINTPLSIIAVNAKSIQNRVDDPLLLKKSQRIMKGIEHIKSLEEQLLFSIRVHSMTLEENAFDLYTQLQEYLPYWNDFREQVNVILEGESTTIVADKTAIMRMVENVVGNAVKYTPEGESVRITLYGGRLVIADRGPGIKDPKRIFEKYYQEKKVTGLGLGLYIVHEIAQRYHIKIEVQTSSSGSSFIFDLEALHAE